MSEEQAFPIISWKSPDGMYATEVQRGMTLRDYFAGQAAVGFIHAFTAGGWHNPNDYQIGVIADGAYRLADAMLKVRGR